MDPLAIEIVVPMVSGAVQGCVYGLLGLGLVLLYKSGRFFNFAQAEMGAFAAFMTAFADQGLGPFPDLPVVPAVLIGLVTGVLLGLVVERVIVRPLFNAPRVTLTVATAGVFLILFAIEGMISGAGPRNATILFTGTLYEGEGGLQITQLGGFIVLVLAVLAAASALFFSRTRMGTAIVAVSQEATAARLVGVSVERTSAFTWGIAGLLGAIAGILLSSSTGAITPGSLTVIALVPAFTAAVFGGITALPGAFVGGVVIGMIEALAGANVPNDALPGAGKVVLFVALLAVLFVRPTGLLAKEA